MTATAIAFLFPTLRVIAQDWNDVHLYSDQTLSQAVQSAILMNQLPGYRLTPDNASVCPALTGEGANPCSFALLVYKSLRFLFMNTPDSYKYRTRAMGESFGSIREFLTRLELDIDDIENGSKFVGWQSYHAWVAGMAGVPVGLLLTNVNVSAPFFTANVSTAGVTITPSSPVN